jgi:PHP family Zn ribbon phosphoesterase
MSPQNILNRAAKKGLDIIGITDHNTTLQAILIAEKAKDYGIFVLCGAEVTSKEEVHCLCFLPDTDRLGIFQKYLDENLPDIKNNPDKFGYQVCVDKDENIIYEENRLLISAINQTIEQIEQKVHMLNGIFIPAHINKTNYSIISQLGFVNPDLKVEALELSKHITKQRFLNEHKYLSGYTFIQSSDAHFVDDIGSVYTNINIRERSFTEIKKALLAGKVSVV